MSYEIKELSVGGILDQAIRVTQSGLVVFLGIVCCLLVPVQIGMGLAQVAVSNQVAPDATPQERMEAQAAAGPLLGAIILISMVASLIAQPLTAAALTFAISDLYLGGTPTVGNSFARALRRWGPLLWTTILYGLAVGAGFLLLIIPGIIAALWFYLHQPVVVLEKTSGIAALKRSRALMKGNLGKAFVIGFLVMIILIGAGMCANLIPEKHVTAIASGVLNGLAAIFSSAVGVVFYFSTRCQHEAFDLKRLAEAVGESDEPLGAEPAIGL